MKSVKFDAEASVQNFAIKGALQELASFDFSPGYELDRRLKKTPALLAEFVKDPAAVAKREVNLVTPKGWHMHFITEQNEYMPPEGDAISQLAAGHSGTLWSRVEIRMAAGPGCFAICVICG